MHYAGIYRFSHGDLGWYGNPFLVCFFFSGRMAAPALSRAAQLAKHMVFLCPRHDLPQEIEKLSPELWGALR